MFSDILLQSEEGNSLVWDEKPNCFSLQHCNLVRVLPAAELSSLYDSRDVIALSTLTVVFHKMFYQPKHGFLLAAMH